MKVGAAACSVSSCGCHHLYSSNPNTFANLFGSCWLFQTYKICIVLWTIAYTIVTFLMLSNRIS